MRLHLRVSTKLLKVEYGGFRQSTTPKYELYCSIRNKLFCLIRNKNITRTLSRSCRDTVSALSPASCLSSLLLARLSLGHCWDRGLTFPPSLTGDDVVLLRTYLPALRHIFHRQKPARSCPAPQPDGDATVTPTGTPKEPCGVSSQSPAVLLSEPDDAGTQNGAWSRPRVGCFLHPEPCTWSGLPAPCVCEPRPPPRAFTITLRSEECEVSPSP